MVRTSPGGRKTRAPAGTWSPNRICNAMTVWVTENGLHLTFRYGELLKDFSSAQTVLGIINDGA
jgi:hypothetical protein